MRLVPQDVLPSSPAFVLMDSRPLTMDDLPRCTE
jgi:hypothetical protein